MSKKGKNSSHAGRFLKDLIFVGPFFILSFSALKGWNAVPTDDPFWSTFWAALVALAMASVAWLAFQMFKVVLVDQLETNRAHETKK